jgi:ABC-type transporter Mla subunit MlaD
MASETEIRRKLAAEREQLTDAVASLREELGHAADRGKKVGAAVGAAGGVFAVVRLLLRLRRR